VVENGRRSGERRFITRRVQFITKAFPRPALLFRISPNTASRAVARVTGRICEPAPT